MNARLSLVAAVSALVVSAPAASAQYFGRNKVQYQSFNFQVLRTPHFDLYFYPEEQEAAQSTARMAERWYARLGTLLGDSLHRRQPVILYASQAQFQQTNAIPDDIGEGTGGVTESAKRRVIIPVSVSLAETDHVLGHELVHAFQYDITGHGRNGSPGATSLPLWFIEGMAEYLSLGPADPNTAMWLRDAVQRNALPQISDLDKPKYFPYRWGQAFWAYVGGRYGDDMIGPLLRTAAQHGDPMAAIRQILHVEPDSLSRQWHTAMRAAYSSLVTDAQAPDQLGRPVLTEATTGGRLNVSPALSPDGQRVAFLSERERFSVEMFIADATTGRVERRLTQTALDGHLESLEFIQSAGAWDARGRRLAFAAIVRGRAALEVVNAETGAHEREITLPELDAVINPTWSPDGRAIAFAAQTGGFTDLFIYDLAAGRLRRLTHDPYADLHPAWSPDGRTIAFATDRFGTRLGPLTYGEYRLALFDVASGQIRPVAGFDRGRATDPQWSADGRSLYFIGDPDGVANVYRVALADGALLRITDLATGASGITALSPALSVAGDRIALSVYRDDKYEVYRLDGTAALAGRPVGATVGDRGGMLPPLTRSGAEDKVGSYLADAATGLPPAEAFPVHPYHASLGLDYVAQPNLVAGVDRLGAFVGGGASLYWSSMLGDHQLATGVEVLGSFANTAAQISYANLTHRLDWALSASQVPLISAGFSQTIESVNGQPALVDRQLSFTQMNRQVAGAVMYPLSRVQRIEVSAGAQQISFSEELRARAIDQAGNVVYDSTTHLPVPASLGLGVATAALVYDNSVFGGTAPVLGHRYRFEVSPTVGSINYVGALADLRGYIPTPLPKVTLATRLMHYGRYGSGGADPRLAPLFLGYQSLVRGYNDASFSGAECVPTAASTCPVFDQLLGSRMLVGNAELRLPLLGPLAMAGRAFPPLDFALFADGGVAWNQGESPTLFGGTRRAVSSVGGALRLNFFGFLIGEADYVRPLDRPQRGWYWQFGIKPGF